ncbi:double-cubane-cluster-containing anaerobic reductase [Campylobacter sp.]|uniref:double-cubane-cluster-containing anaerobic reductase n=1 Tax=Campylobacter sp. TaxID=205 RepID=UPI00270FA854|nr:double-cubane-cluster-containing anaerobic reductase [Campylobacter sp.]
MRMDFEKLKKRNSFELQSLKAQGKPIVGTFCTYSPKELIYAAGGVAVSLCANDETPINAAHKELPRNLCPLIKASYGYALSKKCPYMNASDLIVGETTCDGKKKMYELLANHKDVYVLELPNMTNRRSLELWHDELVSFKKFLEDKFKTEITEDKLLEAVQIHNEERELMCELMELNKQIPSPVSGSELHEILFASEFIYDKKDKIKTIKAYIKAKKETYQAKISDKKRIMITGCPSGGVYEKIIKQIENLGADVVVFENCVGTKNHQNLVKTDGNLMQNIAKRYLKIPCSVMYQNESRVDTVKKFIKEYSVDGVIDIILSGCHTYAIETTKIRETSKEAGANYMSLETDYSSQDSGQIRTRLEAFIELL